MRYLLLLALMSCGYHKGDLDHALDCATGCSKPNESPTSSTCTVVSASNGVIITCPDSTSSIILNGSPGTNGTDGKNGIDGLPGKDSPLPTPAPTSLPSSYTFIDVVDPCGKQASFDEILFKTEAGPYVAYFAGNGGFLTLLHDGNYITTDGTHCYFSIVNNEVINEHN